MWVSVRGSLVGTSMATTADHNRICATIIFAGLGITNHDRHHCGNPRSESVCHSFNLH